jgi:hypothetical protein
MLKKPKTIVLLSLSFRPFTLTLSRKESVDGYLLHSIPNL